MKERLRIGAMIASLLLPMALTASDLPKEVLLWPDGAPGSAGKSDPEKVRVTATGDHVVSSVHRPSITPFLPSADKATGAAAVCIPGRGPPPPWMAPAAYHVAPRFHA